MQSQSRGKVGGEARRDESTVEVEAEVFGGDVGGSRVVAGVFRVAGWLHPCEFCGVVRHVWEVGFVKVVEKGVRVWVEGGLVGFGEVHGWLDAVERV